MNQAFDRALSTLKRNRDLLEDAARRLLEVETLEGEELDTLLGRVRPLPAVEAPQDQAA